VSLNYAYPALAAIKGETGENPEDIHKVRSRIPGAFDGIRSNIDKLSGEIFKDPSTVLLFDSVVASQLQDKSMMPQEREHLTKWLETERENKARAAQMGALLGGGLFIASFMPQLKGISLGLRLAGIGVGGAVAVSEIPDLMMLDLAAQSGRGGAGKLTSQSPEQARFNLVMGYMNVGLAGLDAGLEVGMIQRLTQIPGVLRSAATLTRQQSQVLVSSLARLRAEVSDAVIERMVQAIRGADNLTAGTIFNADGTLSQSRPLGELADRLETTATARASGKAKPPKAFDEYLNASRVKPFVGTKVDPNNLPPGYLYGKVPLENGKFREVIYMATSNGEKVPLKLDAKGIIKMADEGEHRIVNSNAYTKNIETIPGKSGKLLGKNSQIHHLIPDNVIRQMDIFQEALKRGIYNPDRTSNLIEMANKSVAEETLNALRSKHPNAQLTDIRHYSSHEKYDNLTRQLLNDAVDGGDIRQLPDGEILNIIDDVESKLREGFLGTDAKMKKRLPINKDNRLVETPNVLDGEIA
jgi:hypothetical protein